MPALADDSASSIADGGLVPRSETRIVMAKEVLRISETKVVVDYDFRNDTDQDVTTEVAFPIPPYENEFAEDNVPYRSFQNFRLWVDGKPIHYETEAKATLKRKDVTALLEADHIDIPTFGHYDDSTVDANQYMQILVPDFTRLPKETQSRLYKKKIFENLSGAAFGRWSVHLQYHWTQTFPAHSTVHIRHDYSPVLGGTLNMPVQGLYLALTPGLAQTDAGRWNYSGAGYISGFCPGPDLLQGMISRFSEVLNSLEGGRFEMLWLDFILTSANTWQRPIEDFMLIVERPQPKQDWNTIISFCSPANGAVEKLDADHLQVHLTNFVPASELHIGFFEVPPAKASQSAAKK